MNRATYLNQLIIDKSVAEKLSFNPYYPIFQSGLGDPIIVNGKELVNLASNNYLGIAGSERVKTAVIEGVRRYGVCMCGTPIATGYVDAFSRVEGRLAEFVGLEATTLFPSCYQANVGIFSTLAKKEDVILFDHYAHASLITGVRSVGCRVLPYRHNDTRHLEKLLQELSGYRQVFLVTESVFSTEGSIAPFDEIVRLCEEYDVLPVIDDSHGIGVIGDNGRGILEKKRIRNYQGIYTASLGKALANFGGMVGGDKSLIEYLRYACSSLIYSTALPPSILLGIEKALDIVEAEFPVLGARMWRYKDLISSRLRELGFSIIEGQAPITSVACGGLAETIRFAKELYSRHILSTPFVPPSVPPNMGRVRLIAGADLQESSVQQALEAFAGMAEVGL
jgi:7-keto-8-aminopelargonate synthetase-like enzyme